MDFHKAHFFCCIVLDETTYYFSIFALDQNNTIIDVQSNSITTDFWKREPTANTISYFPLQSNATDQMWRYSLSNSWTEQTLWRRFTWQTTLNTTPTWVNTVVAWLKLNTLWSANYVQFMRLIAWNLCFYIQWNANNPCFWLYIQPTNYEWWSHLIGTWQWYLIWITREKVWNTTIFRWYVNDTEFTIFSWNMPYTQPDNQWLIFTNQTVNMDISNFIMETKTWSQSDFEKYFKKYKSWYWY